MCALAATLFGSGAVCAMRENGGASDDFDGSTGFDNVVTAAGNDCIETNGRNDVVDAGSGCDSASLGYGDDVFVGRESGYTDDHASASYGHRHAGDRRVPVPFPFRASERAQTE